MQSTKINDNGRMSTTIILLACGLVSAFVVWACFAEVEEITRGEGRVIPSQKTQIVQTSEPGVVKAIFVRLGQRIKKGDLIFRLDKTPTSANLGELEAKMHSLKIKILRLTIERDGKIDEGFECSTEHKLSAAGDCFTERKLFQARKKGLRSRIEVLKERAEQKQQELNGVMSETLRLKETLKLAQQELELIAPMARRKIIAETELLRIRRTVSDLTGQLNTMIEKKRGAEAAIREANLQVSEQRLAFQQQAQAELTEKKGEYSVVTESIRGAAERVRRTDIHSPVDGIINEIIITTQGAFVNAGDRLVSVVPIDDKLLVEARVKPSDIAFITVGQPAVVKVTAFDFSIFGGLDGHVENVGADTVVDPVSKEPYYPVVVRTKETMLRGAKGQFQVIAGMVCNVDIMTGKKTIMQYLLKPINKARELAFRER